MRQAFAFRITHIAAALAVSVIGATASAEDLLRRLDVRQEGSEVIVGETMYQYYQGKDFAAINTVLAAKALGRIDDTVTPSEVLLGDLYTAFGMPDEADNVFSRVMSRDMRSQTRNATMLRKGQLQYRKGDYFEAERMLNIPLDTQMTDEESQRRVMLANVLMARSEFTDARNALAPISLDSSLGAYAAYNMGVAYIRANQPTEGIVLLEKVMNLPDGDDERNALKDRAALAIGFSYLQQQAPDKAREILMNVRIKGPFSNSALLAQGWANYEKKDYKRALAYWLELLTRNPGNPSVREAMILVPRAYEAANAEQQAFYGYKQAINSLTAQLATLEKISTRIQSANWLEQLNPLDSRIISPDPMDVPESVAPKDEAEASVLYALFAEHPFNQGFQQYEQLRRLRLLVDQKRKALVGLSDNAVRLQQRQGPLNASATRVNSTDARLKLVMDRWPIIERRAKLAARDSRNRPSGNNVKAMEMQFKLGKMDEQLRKMPESADVTLLKNRIRMLRGLVVMDNAKAAPVSQEQIYADIASIENQLEMTRLRMEAVRQLLTDNQKIAGRDNLKRIRDLDAGLVQTARKLDQALNEYRSYLRILAKNQLEDTRNQINSDLAEAHLSVARIQDNAILRENNAAPAGTGNKE